MAFFTRINTTIPFLPNEQNSAEESGANKDDKKQCPNNDNEKVGNNESQTSESKKESTRYDYVVDRVLGVEV